MQSLTDKGELDAASQVLARGRKAARAHRIDASRDEAKILLLDARVDDLQLAYRSAASKDGEAAALVAPFDSIMRQSLLRKQAFELYKQGKEFGDNAALEALSTRSSPILHRRQLHCYAGLTMGYALREGTISACASPAIAPIPQLFQSRLTVSKLNS